MKLHTTAFGEEKLREQLGALGVAEGEFLAAYFVADLEAPAGAFAELDSELFSFADFKLSYDLE